MEISSTPSATTTAALRSADSEKPQLGLSLLKQSLQADKDAVTALLPPQGLLDVRA